MTEHAAAIAVPSAPRQKIGDQSGTCRDLFAEPAVFAGEQKEPADREDREQHQQQRRQDAADTSAVEIQQVERAVIEIRQYRRRKQIARDDEKNVDTEMAAAQPLRRSAERQHSENGDRPQAVDIGAMDWPLLHVRAGSRYFAVFRKSST